MNKGGNNIFMGIFVFLGFVLMVICYALRTAVFLLPILIPVILILVVISVIVKNRGKK